MGGDGDRTASTEDPSSSADLPGDVRPETDPTPVAALSCDRESYQRHWIGFGDEPRWGETGDGEGPTFALRVENTSYDRGDVARIRLTNVTDRRQSTGNRHKYNLQVYTDDGYREVRYVPDGPIAYTDEAAVHDPGEGFEWAFELTEEGFVDDHVHDLEVCSGLPGGRYRFVFWGIETALAVAFDLEG